MKNVLQKLSKLANKNITSIPVSSSVSLLDTFSVFLEVGSIMVGETTLFIALLPQPLTRSRPPRVRMLETDSETADREEHET